MEWLPSVSAAIRTAVSAGIVVVEPAANSGIDLASLAGQAPWLADPGHPDNSGALIVGAGGSVARGNDLVRSAVSNYGARVDVQGYGEAVLTIVDGGGPRSYRFGNMVALTNFQCDMEEMLLKTGWSFVHFSPEQRTGRERRRSPRILGDRRRWWTDDPTILPRRSRDA